MTNPLDAYRLPPEVADGTWIEVPGTPVQVRCTLPSSHNEAFQIAWLNRLGEDVAIDTDKGELRGHTSVLKPTMRAAFVDACIKEVKGLPDGVTLEDFIRDYRLAVDSVMEQAQTLGGVMDTRVNDALKNLKTFSNGRVAGKVAPKTTKSAKKRTTSKTESAAPN